MRIFVDAADPREIEEALKTGTVDGITIDLKLISPEINLQTFFNTILALIKKHKPGAHLDIGGAFFQKPGQASKFAKTIKDIVKYEHFSVQIPIGFHESAIISELKKHKILVNCVACMTINQGILAALTGAEYVSFLWSDIRDSAEMEKAETDTDDLPENPEQLKFKYKEMGRALDKALLDPFDLDPEKVVGATHRLFDFHKLPTKIIACSIRSPVDARDAFLAGADIVAIPLGILKEMSDHFMTEKVIDQFRDCFREQKSDE